MWNTQKSSWHKERTYNKLETIVRFIFIIVFFQKSFTLLKSHIIENHSSLLWDNLTKDDVLWATTSVNLYNSGRILVMFFLYFGFFFPPMNVRPLQIKWRYLLGFFFYRHAILKYHFSISIVIMIKEKNSEGSLFGYWRWQIKKAYFSMLFWCQEFIKCLLTCLQRRVGNFLENPCLCR